MTLDELASPYYRDQLATMHRASHWGYSSGKFAQELVHLARKVGGRTVLDYGCGRSNLAKVVERKPYLGDLELEFRRYDPGIPGLDTLPEPADVVLCVDVLEHVEPDRVQAVIDHLHSVTQIAALIAIATRPAEKRLPDGRNAHLTIDHHVWWRDQLAKRDWQLSIRSADMIETKFWVRKSRGVW